MSIAKEPKTPFGLKLRGLRKALKQSQDKVGAAVGVTGGAISRWELGGDFPNRKNLKLLCDHFGVMLSYFGLESMGEAEERPDPAPAVMEKQPVTQPSVQQVAIEIPQPVLVPLPVLQPQGALPADVEAAINTILRLDYDSQNTLMSHLSNLIDGQETKRRLTARLAGGGAQ